MPLLRPSLLYLLENNAYSKDKIEYRKTAGQIRDIIVAVRAYRLT